MRPLLFVNWASVSAKFRGLMWLIAIVLVVVIVIHVVPGSPPVHPSGRLPH